MRFIALETSTDTASVALWQNGEILSYPCPAGAVQSDVLIPLVQSLLAEASLSFASLDGIAFDCGPGAFTGLRVACGVAQGFALAADLPVLGIGSLEILTVQSEYPKVLALLDARMNEVYAGLYRDGVLHGAIGVYPPDRLAQLLENNKTDWAVCGNAVAAYPQIQTILASRISHWPAAAQVPRAADLSTLAAPRFQAGEGVDAAQAVPVYIRDKVALTTAERLAQGNKT